MPSPTIKQEHASLETSQDCSAQIEAPQCEIDPCAMAGLFAQTLVERGTSAHLSDSLTNGGYHPAQQPQESTDNDNFLVQDVVLDQCLYSNFPALLTNLTNPDNHAAPLESWSHQNAQSTESVVDPRLCSQQNSTESGIDPSHCSQQNLASLFDMADVLANNMDVSSTDPQNKPATTDEISFSPSVFFPGLCDLTTSTELMTSSAVEADEADIFEAPVADEALRNAQKGACSPERPLSDAVSGLNSCDTVDFADFTGEQSRWGIDQQPAAVPELQQFSPKLQFHSHLPIAPVPSGMLPPSARDHLFASSDSAESVNVVAGQLLFPFNPVY